MRSGACTRRAAMCGPPAVGWDAVVQPLRPSAPLPAVVLPHVMLCCLLVPLQLIVFDLEYGQPAASSPLPASRAPLEDLLGCYGHAGEASCVCLVLHFFRCLLHAWRFWCGCIGAAWCPVRQPLSLARPVPVYSCRQGAAGGRRRCALLLPQAWRCLLAAAHAAPWGPVHMLNFCWRSAVMCCAVL